MQGKFVRPTQPLDREDLSRLTGRRLFSSRRLGVASGGSVSVGAGLGAPPGMVPDLRLSPVVYGHTITHHLIQLASIWGTTPFG